MAVGGAEPSQSWHPTVSGLHPPSSPSPASQPHAAPRAVIPVEQEKCRPVAWQLGCGLGEGAGLEGGQAGHLDSSRPLGKRDPHPSPHQRTVTSPPPLARRVPVAAPRPH